MIEFKIGDRVEVRPSLAYGKSPLVGVVESIDRDHESIDGHPCYIVRVGPSRCDGQLLRSYVGKMKLIDAVTLLGDTVR